MAKILPYIIPGLKFEKNSLKPSPQIENQIGSVVIEIFNYKQKTSLLNVIELVATPPALRKVGDVRKQPKTTPRHIK